MKNSFAFHFHAVRITFSELFKGRFLYFFIPGLILTAFYLLIQYYTNSAREAYTLGESEISWLDWVYGMINKGTSTMFSIFDVIMQQVYIFFVLTVLSPFNTILSERLDSQLTGQKFKTTLARFINDFIRMIFVVLIAVMAEIGFMLAWWLLSWIIGSELIDSIMYFLIAAFFFAFSFYDYSFERYGKGMFDSFNYAFSNPVKMLLTGSIFLLIYSIPVAGIPISPVIAVMISTIVYLYDTGKLPATPTKDNSITTHE